MHTSVPPSWILPTPTSRLDCSYFVMDKPRVFNIKPQHLPHKMFTLTLTRQLVSMAHPTRSGHPKGLNLPNNRQETMYHRHYHRFHHSNNHPNSKSPNHLTVQQSSLPSHAMHPTVLIICAKATTILVILLSDVVFRHRQSLAIQVAQVILLHCSKDRGHLHLHHSHSNSLLQAAY